MSKECLEPPQIFTAQVMQSMRKKLLMPLIITMLMMPMKFMNMSMRNRKQPLLLKRPKRPLNIQWTLMDLNIILGMMNSHSTCSMNTSKLKKVTGIATLSIFVPLEK
jgi:hypothetical protein